MDFHCCAMPCFDFNQTDFYIVYTENIFDAILLGLALGKATATDSNKSYVFQSLYQVLDGLFFYSSSLYLCFGRKHIMMIDL